MRLRSSFARRPCVVTRTDVQSSDTDVAAASAYTFAGVALGAASSRRLMVVYAAVGNAAVTGFTCSIAGITATEIAGSATTKIFAAFVPTGTSGNVVLTIAGATADSAAIIVWQITNVYNLTPVATMNVAHGSNPIAGTIDGARGGAAIFGMDTGFAVITGAWTGATEDTETNYISNTLDRSQLGAHLEFTAAETAHAVSLTKSALGTFGSLRGCSFR